MCYICTVSVRLFSHKELRMDFTYGCSPLNRETDWLKGNSERNLARSIYSGRFELN